MTTPQRFTLENGRVATLQSGLRNFVSDTRAMPMTRALDHSAPNPVATAFAADMRSDPMGGNRAQYPGRARERQVAYVSESAVDMNVFGRPLVTLSGLDGSGCTGNGAVAAAALISAGTAVGTGYASGALGTQVRTASTSTTPTAAQPAASQSMTTGQKIGTAASIIGTLTTATWGAVCAARGNADIVTATGQGNAATTSAIQTIQAARSGQNVSAIAAANAATAAAVTDTPTTTVTLTPASTAADDKTMWLIGGGVVVLGLLGILFLKD